jgi:uncharacterized protein (TIGR03437 family)
MSVTPGSLISIFGSNLAATTATADTIPLSTALGNVSVTIGGVAAPLNGVFHSSSGDQINAQLPWSVPTGPTQVVVTNNGVASPAQTVTIAPFSPGVFSVNFGVGQAIAINPDGSLAAPAGSIAGLTTRPAKISDPGGIIILATGLGAVNPAATTGSNSRDTLRNTVTTPVVMVGGVAAKVIFSGLSPDFVGVNQINILLAPNTPVGDKEPLQIQIGGLTSNDQVTMAVTQ